MIPGVSSHVHGGAAVLWHRIQRLGLFRIRDFGESCGGFHR